MTVYVLSKQPPVEVWFVCDICRSQVIFHGPVLPPEDFIPLDWVTPHRCSRHGDVGGVVEV